MDFPNNASLADAIACLIREIGAKNVYLLGQSYGGMIAQITAKRHPDIIKGMILSGTCGLGQGMDEEGLALINKILDPKKIARNVKIDKKFPIWLLVSMFKLMACKLIKDIIDICKDSMSGKYFALMDTLLGDVLQYDNTETKEDFLPFENEVLIFFSKEDTIFCDSLKQNLVDLMTNSTVVWNLKGGHLAMMTSINEYVETLSKFIHEKNKQ